VPSLVILFNWFWRASALWAPQLPGLGAVFHALCGIFTLSCWYN